MGTCARSVPTRSKKEKRSSLQTVRKSVSARLHAVDSRKVGALRYAADAGCFPSIVNIGSLEAVSLPYREPPQVETIQDEELQVGDGAIDYEEFCKLMKIEEVREVREGERTARRASENTVNRGRALATSDPGVSRMGH